MAETHLKKKCLLRMLLPLPSLKYLLNHLLTYLKLILKPIIIKKINTKIKENLKKIKICTTYKVLGRYLDISKCLLGHYNYNIIIILCTTY